MAEEKTNKDIFSGKSEFDIPSFNSAQIDKEIAKLSKPNQQNNVYSKLAAMYEQQGVGAVLRTQKNISNLFGPALDLYKQRKNAADEAFATNLENSPEIDDTFIFGELDGTPMPITDEIRGLSDVIRQDLRDLSYLNPTDPRYAELRKNIEENQDKIVKFNDLNKKLLNIRNSEVDRSKWSQGMKEEEVRMWDDIYNSRGENIKIIDGQPTYVDPINGEKIDLSKIGDSPIEKNQQASIDYTNYNSAINSYASKGAGMDDFNYDKIIGGAFRFLGNLDNAKISSLIFDGYNLDPILGSGPVTTDFLHGVIQQKYGNEIDTPEEFVEKINELKKIGINKAEFGEKGDKTLRQLFLEYEQEKAIDVIKSGDVSTIFSINEKGEIKSNKNNRTGKTKNNKNKTTTSSLELSDDLLNTDETVIIDNVNVSDIYNNLNTDNLKDIFKLKEDQGKYILEALLPEGFEVKTTGPGAIDKITISYNGKNVSNLDFDIGKFFNTKEFIEDTTSKQANKLIKDVKEKTGVDISALLGSASNLQ